MSVQFGKCNFDGKPVDPQELDRVRPMLAPHGPDVEGCFRKDNVGIIYRAFHTTKESRLESQPHVSALGAVITWDGRLDNRGELIHAVGGDLSSNSTDLAIVGAVYEHWGTDSFAKLIGDWAISIWDPRTQSLVLAKDFFGTRHLYYSFYEDQVTWGTILDPLILFARKPFALCEEYIAGWLSFFPAAHLTPYVGIDSVPPSSFVVLQRGKHMIKKYWDFDPSKRIRYRTDGEYEEHFRDAFGKAVARRLRSDSPILAELSGGMDSSSIVCMGDTIITRGSAETPRLDTLSYYDDSEPNWNERPFLAKVEEKRGRRGCHIDVSSLPVFNFELEDRRFPVTPASVGCPTEATRQFATCRASQGNRVVLSGIGGDEVTGGIPSPAPELADLLAEVQVKALAHQLKVWALNKRIPWLYLFFEAARLFFPSTLVGVSKEKRPAPWLHSNFVRKHRLTFSGYESRLLLFGPLPSFQENVSTVNALRRQLAVATQPDSPCEKRYPYLDRDLLEFICAIPREQLVRAAQRRSLMRRSLAGIVPSEILNRKRKSFVARAPMAAVSTEWATLAEMSRNMVSSDLDIVDETVLAEVLQRARYGQQIPVVQLARTLRTERWLRALQEWCPRIVSLEFEDRKRAQSPGAAARNKTTGPGRMPRSLPFW